MNPNDLPSPEQIPRLIHALDRLRQEGGTRE